MDKHQPTPQELFELWLAANDEQPDVAAMSDAQREAFNRLIIENANVREQLIALSRQQAWLMWHGSASKAGSIDVNNVDAVVARVHTLVERADRSTVKKSSGVLHLPIFLTDITSEPSVLFRPPLVFCTLLLATLLGALTTQWIVDRSDFAGLAESDLHRLPLLQNEAVPQRFALPVAYLTSANGCSWSSVTPLFHNAGAGAQVGDELALSEGIAEFRMANGVYLGIEGPASLLLLSPSSVVLQYGKLTAHVPWGTADFKVVTAGCRVTANDAEFGLSRTESKLDIHVFSGELAAASSIASTDLEEDEGDGSEKAFSDAIVSAGRSLSLTTDGEFLAVHRWGKAKPRSFVAKLSMSGALPITPAYVDQVRLSAPIAYWRFEQIVDNCVPNEIDASTPLIARSNSLLVGSRDNLSAELRWDGDWYFKSKKKLSLAGSDYSIEAWMKPSHRHLGTLAYLHYRENNLHSGVRLELQGSSDRHTGEIQGALRYVQRTYKEKADWGTSCFSSQPYAIRRWQHVVAVKRGPQMELYLDGELCGSGADDSQLSLDPVVLVGAHRDRYRRKFIGQLDELAVYNRALTEKEISRHYETLNRATDESRRNETQEQIGARSKEA